MFRPFLALALAGAAFAQQKAGGGADDPAAGFFASAPLVQVHIVLDDAARAGLRDRPRDYVSAVVRIDDATLPAVGVKLKGAHGSFRSLDERPGFTLNLGKFGGTARLHGLRRFHLNNGEQDPSRLCEWLGSEVFAAARLPAPRVGHALVWLDDRLLGLYVLREAYDAQFLQRAFGSVHGNLYDGGFCQDVDSDLEKDAGDGADDRADLHAFGELCRGIDRQRAAALAAAIDVPGFVDFVALEAMLGHWDGYAQNANNFRLWLPTGGKATFLPHGMDQLFGDADASILDHPPAIVASAVMQQPALRRRYRERLRALLPLFDPSRLTPRLTALATSLERGLARVDADAAREFAAAARDLQQRVGRRYASLTVQVHAAEPKPLALARGRPFLLKRWNPAAETDAIELDRKDLQGVTSLLLRVTARDRAAQQGAWRTHVLLGHGRYELRAKVHCRGVDAAGGARLRAGEAASEPLHGDVAWQAVVCAFEVGEFQSEVELACELHGGAGQAAFRVDSLQLVRVDDGE